MEQKITFYQKAFAKVLDFLLLYIALSLTAVASPFSITNDSYLYLVILTPILWVPFEIIFLLTWGSTPGGACLGISPRSATSQRLTFSESLRLSLFLEKTREITWVSYPQKLGRQITRLVIGCALLMASLFSKALFQFPQEFQRTFSAQQGWMEYTSPTGDFTAIFPGEPEVNEMQFPIPKTNKSLDYSEYRSDEKKVTYSIGVLEIPSKWRIFSSSTILKNALKVVVENLDNAQLLNKKSLQHDGYPGLDFTIELDDHEIKGRLILVDEKLYKVEFSHEHDTLESTQELAFIESFSPNT